MVLKIYMYAVIQVFEIARNSIKMISRFLEANETISGEWKSGKSHASLRSHVNTSKFNRALIALRFHLHLKFPESSAKLQPTTTLQISPEGKYFLLQLLSRVKIYRG